MTTHALKKFKTTQELGKWYDEKYKEMGGCWLTSPEDCKRHIDFIGLEKSRKFLLDIGSGSGDFTAEAHKLVITCGWEMSFEAIRLAKEKYPDPLFLYLDIEKDSPISKAFDYITSIGSIEHCIDIDKALKHCRRWLKDDGLLYVFAPNEEWNHFDQPQEQTHTDEEWIKIFKKAGFRIIKHERWNDSTAFLMEKSF